MTEKSEIHKALARVNNEEDFATILASMSSKRDLSSNNNLPSNNNLSRADNEKVSSKIMEKLDTSEKEALNILIEFMDLNEHEFKIKLSEISLNELKKLEALITKAIVEKLENVDLNKQDDIRNLIKSEGSKKILSLEELKLDFNDDSIEELNELDINELQNLNDILQIILQELEIRVRNKRLTDNEVEIKGLMTETQKLKKTLTFLLDKIPDNKLNNKSKIQEFNLKDRDLDLSLLNNKNKTRKTPVNSRENSNILKNASNSMREDKNASSNTKGKIIDKHGNIFNKKDSQTSTINYDKQIKTEERGLRFSKEDYYSSINNNKKAKEIGRKIDNNNNNNNNNNITLKLNKPQIKNLSSKYEENTLLIRNLNTNKDLNKFTEQREGTFISGREDIIKPTIERVQNISEIGSKEILNQISRQIKTYHRPGTNSIELQLEPEFLGKVKLNIKVEAGEVNAKILVDNFFVKEQLEQNIYSLKMNLMRQGLNMEHLEIEVENYNTDLQDESSFQGQSGQEGNNREREDELYYNKQEFNLSAEEIEKLLNEDINELVGPANLRREWSLLNYQYNRMNILA
jgi:flagellar hook-length control protein FliK